MQRKNVVVLFLFALVFMTYGVMAVEPFGATPTVINSSRAPADTAGNNSAIAGNVTELTISGFSNTQSWQGYVGNVSGTIQLADVNDNVLYNWSLASPQGEIYASTNTSLSWTYVQCLNFSADGTYASDTAQAGATSLFGTNLTQLEAAYNIITDDVDGVNETFTLLGSGHDLFYTNNLQFSSGECRNTRIFNNTGAGADNQFEEALLYDPVSRAVIFASILDEDALGFDNKPHDFEMLVLEDGHGTNVATTTYFFWVELE